jgi:GT2 family glycosyltransferase
MKNAISNKIAVTILNWNGIELLKKFIPTLLNNTNQEIADIWIIDNNSTDNSTEYIKINFPNINLVILDKNYGFAHGYNKGLAKIVNYKYYLLLNSDVEVTRDWLSPLYNLMENNKNIAVCGPKLLDYKNRAYFEYAGASGGFVDKYCYPFCRGRIFQNIERDNHQYDSLIECLWVSGAALMVRTELFNKVNGFDSMFFAHQEEIDLCWRLQNLGYSVVCEPKSFVYHVGGATLDKTNPHKTFLNFRNNLYLIKRNLPRAARNRVLFVRFFLDIIAAIRMIFEGLPKDAIAVLKAYFAFWKNSKKLKESRKSIKPKKTKYIVGYYKKSIVVQNFIKKNNKFSNLKAV